MNVKKMAKKIKRHYMEHGAHIKLQILGVDFKYDRYIFRVILGFGAKESIIFERASDIQIALQIPLFQPFKENVTIYLVVSPNNLRQNNLSEMLRSQEFCDSKYQLPIALGYDSIGRKYFGDIAEMPHILYAGSTNSGKSVGLANLVLSLIIKQKVSVCNIIIFDVGANSMSMFEGVPHLSYPVVKDMDTGIYVIAELARELSRRVNLDKDKLADQPSIVCVIDEYISFINNADKNQSKEIKCAISDILRRGRHGKIHMVLAAQNPTQSNMAVDISNVTERVSFKCAKYQNSIAIINKGGAEKLSGKGAMMYSTGKYPDPIFLQGAYMPPDEMRQVVERVKLAEYDLENKFIIPQLDPSELMLWKSSSESKCTNGIDGEKELADIIMWALGCSQISANKLKKQFPMGNRANDIIETLYQMKIISEKSSKQPRKVIPVVIDDLSAETVCLLERNGYDKARISEVIISRKS